MNTLIPATPGWYLEETCEDGEVTLDPVIAWKVATDNYGDEVLLPFVDAGPGDPPFAHTAASFAVLNRHVVYRPNHDPGAAQ
ncbi:hypothetical protein ABTX71_01695 [Streptomyces parvulus]|uniref:hypothetical protein n=1 Tax=Streptomyces parvulus TaxID=146923 RepID=UPI0033330B5C